MGRFRRALVKSRFRRLRRKFGRRGRKRMRFTSASVQRPMVRLGQGFPKKILMTHKYSDNFTMTSTASALITQFYSCNGMFKPDQTSAGHQPMLFDQMGAIYDHYCVIGSKIVWRITPQQGSPNASQMGCYINDDTTGTPLTIAGIAEQPTGQTKIMSPLPVRSMIFVQKWSAKKYFSRNPLANDELQGTTAANPVETSNFNLTLTVVNGATMIFQVQVSITYIAIWKEVKDLPGS